MSKNNYLRKRQSLTIGGKSEFHCKKCGEWFYRKDEFKKHYLAHRKI